MPDAPDEPAETVPADLSTIKAPAPEATSTTPTVEASTDLVAAPDMARGAMLDTSIDARIRYARELAIAGLLPAAFRRNPGNVLYAVEFGNMLGIHPLAAITGVHVMDGKPTASPALMSALVRRAGHKLRVRTVGTIEGGDFRATATLIRSDDPDEPFSATWSVERAIRGGLVDSYAPTGEGGRYVVTSRTEKGNPSSWQKYPEAMCKARAIGEVCREGAEEALCGVHYTPEELGVQVDDEGHVIIETTLAEPEETPADVAAREAERLAKLVGPLRERILATTNVDTLTALYQTVAARDDAAAVKAATVANAAGEPRTILELFAEHGRALKGGDDTGDQGDAGGDPGPDTPPAPDEGGSGPLSAADDAYAQVTVGPDGHPFGDDQPPPGAPSERDAAAVAQLTDDERAAWDAFGRRVPYVGKGAPGAIASAELDDQHLTQLSADNPQAFVDRLRASVTAWYVQAALDDDVDAEPVPSRAISSAQPRAAMTRARLGLQGKVN